MRESLTAWIPEKLLEQYLKEGWIVVEKITTTKARFSGGKETTQYVLRRDTDGSKVHSP